MGASHRAEVYWKLGWGQRLPPLKQTTLERPPAIADS